MPIVSGGGGGTPFNGGLITDGLEIDPPSGTEALKIVSVNGNSTKMIDAVAVHTTFTVDSDGTVAISSDDTLGVTLTGSGNTDANLSVQGTAAARVSTGISTSTGIRLINVGASAVGLDVQDSAGISRAKADPTIGLVTAVQAAPADAALAAGECALWFDRTNGAAKLMLKGKTANGTVVAAAIALA